jgi:hypothetical protein
MQVESLASKGSPKTTEIMRDNERWIIRLRFDKKTYKLLLFEPSQPNSNLTHLTIEPK